MRAPDPGGLRPFAGRTVAITGAAGGIGAALARAFDEAGAALLLLDRRPIDDAPAGAGTAVCDIADPDACRQALQGEPVDVLINNAGISAVAPFAETDDATFRRILDVNVLGAVHCTRAALPSLRERRGVIVTISSVAGFAPLLGRTAYAASKHALHGFMDSLRAELREQGEDVAVLLVCPTFVDTGIHPVGAVQDKAIGKVQTPDQIARTIVAATRRRGPATVLPSATARAAWWVSRTAPRLYSHLMSRAARPRG